MPSALHTGVGGMRIKELLEQVVEERWSIERAGIFWQRRARYGGWDGSVGSVIVRMTSWTGSINSLEFFFFFCGVRSGGGGASLMGEEKEKEETVWRESCCIFGCRSCPKRRSQTTTTTEILMTIVIVARELCKRSDCICRGRL